MNLKEMILDALKFPFSNVNRYLGLLLLLLGSIFIIPAFMALGYIFRIIKFTINGSNELPPFDKLGDMFTDGLKYFAATAIYLIIPNILTFVLSRGMLTSIYSGNLEISTYLLTAVIGLVIALPFDLVYIMALGNMAHEDRFGAAFEFSKIFGLIGRIGWLKYFSYILIFTIIGLVFGTIAEFSTLLRISFGLGWGIIGIILTILIQIYLNLYRGRYVGLIYRKGFHLLQDGPESGDNLEAKENQDIETV